jgi:hypothetical protein
LALLIAVDLLAELDGLGIHLEADGPRLRFRPRDRATPELVGRMKANKDDLLRLLAERALDRRIAEQLARLVPYRTPDGRCILVDPQARDELDRLGLL